MSEDPRPTFRAIAQALAFNPTEYDQFNQDIQDEIRRQLTAGNTDIALDLGTIKLNANKRLYVHNRAAGK